MRCHFINEIYQNEIVCLTFKFNAWLLHLFIHCMRSTLISARKQSQSQSINQSISCVLRYSACHLITVSKYSKWPVCLCRKVTATKGQSSTESSRTSWSREETSQLEMEPEVGMRPNTKLLTAFLQACEVNSESEKQTPPANPLL